MNQTLSIVLSFVLPCLMTTIGAGLVYFFKNLSKTVNILTIGLASGIMISASIWSLLIPSLEASSDWGNLSFLPVSAGFCIGGLFMLILDLVCNKFFKDPQAQKPFKLFCAITLHNIPEGMSVGFAVGLAVATGNSFLSATMFSLGIALQNLPEGLATSLPIYHSTKNKHKAFGLGFLSGIVEPIFAIAGFFLAESITCLLPWLLSISAGAMIYATIEELLPEIHGESKNTLGVISFFAGFVTMMLLDICF